MDWVPAGGIASLFGVLAFLIFRIVRLGVNQEAALLTPAYDEIQRLRAERDQREKAERVCQHEKSRLRLLLIEHGIPVPDGGSI